MNLSLVISVFVMLVLVAVVYWAVHKVAGAFGLPSQLVVVADVFLVALAVFYALSMLGLWPGW